MREGESLKAYSDRYWEMFNDMEGNFDAMALDTFKLGLPTDHGLRTSLVEEDQQQGKGKDKVTPQDRKDFRSDRYNNNRPRRDFAGQSGSANAQAVNTVFKEPVHQVLEKIKNESFFRWPSKMVGNPKRRNHNLYCQYHQDHGHATEDCRSLWDHLDQLVREGRLRHLLHHSSGRGDQANFESKKRDSMKPPLGTINVIFAAPGRTGSWPTKVMSVARLPAGDIGRDPRSARQAAPPILGFSDEDKAGTIQPHDDALVVTLRIGRYDLKRVMVDQGSAVEIMYPNLFKGLNLTLDDLTPYCSPLVSFEGRMVTPKGQIRLPVQTGSEVVEVDFIVVDVYSPYTAIIAKPWLHTLGAVSSTLHQKVKYPSEGCVFAPTFIAGNSICWMNRVCYVAIIYNFPSHRQVLVGIITSYQGLSAKMFTDIVHAVMSSATGKAAQDYLLLNSILPMVVCIIAGGVLALKIDAGKSRSMRVEFFLMFVITTLTGLYSVISSSLSTKILPLVDVIVTGLFLLAPLIVIPIVEKVTEKFAGKWDKNTEKELCAEKINGDVGKMEEGMKEREDDKKDPKVGVKEEIGCILMLQRMDFWLYFFVYFFGASFGQVFLNNLGQIAESRGYPGTALVSLSRSSFGFFGRLIPSLVDYFSRHIISRPALVAALMTPMAISFFLLLSSDNISLFISIAIIGTCTGAITSIAVSITAELYGTKNFSVNHNVVVANIPLGSLIFGNLAAFVYHKEGNGDGKCMGMECYRSTSIIWGSLCSLGIFIALVLYARTRKFYSQLAA
ncbi:LOW QUALITY PROTEIN: protein NUCLEAR FUSION DEFECTIVE 4-like [Quercus suber]|uniref:LOW QUALITY PROTEIN: protein NUCLEAR FUSION DEFECTIVE 4-like n=1 Tax=Quercus suber TaxID=58331 RepID=UPI0032E04ED7